MASERAGNETHAGACLCGAVRFRVTGPLAPVVACHCTMCRKQTGHFLASTNVAIADITVAGGEAVRWFAASERAQRGFCGQCGSVLFWRRPESDRVAIAMGCFEKPTGTAIGRHIFTADKGDYYDIDDAAPQFPGDD